MREFAATFYSSLAWKNCRRAYRKSVGGLCERCLAQGVYTPGSIVHHKVHLNPYNVTNPDITLNFENLELLCAAHHAEEHQRLKKRYHIDENGHVVCI